MSWLHAHRYLLLRRVCQAGILVLFWLGAHTGVDWLTGNLSSSRVLGTVPLSDPYAALQILATGHAPAATVLVGALVIVLFYGVVGGRSFCSWVCPVNPVTDLARWAKRHRRSHGQLLLPRNARYVFLALGLLLLVVSFLYQRKLFGDPSRS